MKQIERKMSLMMGLTLSFFLSLMGNLSSGKFTLPGFLISFVVSFLISMVIGFLVPMGRVNAALGKRFRLERGALKTRCIETLISDLIYTPIITLIMVFMAYKQATSHGAQLSFGPMIGRALLLSLAVGYVLIFICMPFFLKMALKNTPHTNP